MTAPVLVVGGTRGLGLEIVRRLVGQGCAVRVLARDPAAARLGPGVEFAPGDLTRPDTLAAPARGARHIVLTAGVPSGRYAPASLVRATDFDGVLALLAAARAQGFAGRFVYLNSQGVTRPSLAAGLINLLKRNTLTWRARLEPEIRGSGFDYAIVRVPFLTDAPAGSAQVRVSQGALPLSPLRAIGRADAADAFVAAMTHPRASRVTFEITAARGPVPPLAEQLAALAPD